MRNTFQPLHRVNKLVERYAEGVCHSYCSHDVLNVMLTEKLCVKPLFLTRVMHGEVGAFLGNGDVGSGVIPLSAVDAVGDMVLVGAVVPDEFVVVIQEHRSVGHSIGYLEFGLYDVLYRAESLKMLLTDRCDYGVLRMNDVADLLDLAHALSSHFAEEYLVCGIETAADYLHNAHGGVEAAGSHKHVVLRGKQLFEIELGGGLAEASGNADHRSIGQFRDNSLRVVDIVVVDRLFYRLVDEVRKAGHEYAEPRKYRHRSEIQLRAVQKNERQCAYRTVNNGHGNAHSDNAGREHKLLLRRLAERERRNRRAEKHHHRSYPGQHIGKRPYHRVTAEVRPQGNNCREYKVKFSPYRTLPHIGAVLLPPLELLMCAVGIELEHMHEMHEIYHEIRKQTREKQNV